MSNQGRFTLEYELGMLDKEPYSKEIKDLIRKFENQMNIREHLSQVRRMNYVQRLRVVARWIPDKFLEPDKEAMDGVMTRLLSSDYSDYTRETYVTMIRKFYKWYLGEGKRYPEFLDDFKFKVNRDNIRPEELITPDEESALIKAAGNARDRALIATLYDSGARIGELLNMKIGDLRFDEYGAVLKVMGSKGTGFRQIRIVGNSIAYLRAWLDNHPDRNNRDSWLFCGLSGKEIGNQLDYWEVYAALKRTLKRGGIKRRIHPHLFRHTRATILASKVAEAPLESQMGWKHGSRQTSTYVHLSFEQQDNAILKGDGIEVKEDKGIREERPKECPRCHQLNASDAEYCRNCWMPFSVEKVIEFKEKEKEIETAVVNSNVIDGLTKALVKGAPQESKVRILRTLLEEILKDEDLMKTFREEISKQKG